MKDEGRDEIMNFMRNEIRPRWVREQLIGPLDIGPIRFETLSKDDQKRIIDKLQRYIISALFIG